MNRFVLASFFVLATLFTACGDGLDIPRHPTRLVYDGTTGDIPSPNDTFFEDNPAGPNLDATLNFPPASDASQQHLFDALNSLDGWSTSAPLSFHFSRAVDPASVTDGVSVRLFEVDAVPNSQTGLKIGMPLNDVLAELAFGVDYAVSLAASDVTGTTWNVVPLRPLRPKTIYMLVVTNAIRDMQGYSVVPGSSYALAKSDVTYPPGHPSAGLQVLVAAMEILASTDPDVVPAIPEEDIVAALTFTTQSTLDVLSATRLVSSGQEQTLLDGLCAGAPGPGHAACSAAPANTVPTGAVLASAGTTLDYGFDGEADVYTASLTLPYYLTAAPNPTGGLVQSSAPLTERWRSRFSYLEGVAGADPMETEFNATRYNTLPIETGVESVPVLITLPGSTSGQVQPVSGWPVVIFQHGIKRDRTDLLSQADSLALAGFATVAIDLPLHGLTTTGGVFGALHAGVMDGGLRERTFGLDLLTQDAGGDVTAATPDGVADTTGAHFINFSSLQTQRDNLRQAVTDLFAVVKLIQDNLNVDGSAVIVADDFDPSRIHFIGHSMGAIVGTTFAAVDAAGPSPALVSASLNAPGGGIPRLFEASPELGPALIAELALAGLVQDTPGFDLFMFAAQSTVDSGDPINFCAALNGGALPVLLQEIVGGGAGGGIGDQVVPNSVAGAPLSGTDPMISSLGLTVVTTTTATAAGAVRFSEGTHDSLIDPDPDMDGDLENQKAFVEMQAELSSWLASIATTPTVTITDSDVIAP